MLITLMLMLPYFTCHFVRFLRCTRYPLSCMCFRIFSNGSRTYLCTKSNDDNGKICYGNIKLPPEPQNCCMSGCANCVWVAYAEEVAKIFNDGGETARQKIMECVKDPSLRAFILMELKQVLDKERK